MITLRVMATTSPKALYVVWSWTEPVVASLRPVTKLPLETHLMISNPDLFLQEFADSGSDSFLVHWEGNVNLHRTVQRIRALGKRASSPMPSWRSAAIT